MICTLPAALITSILLLACGIPAQPLLAGKRLQWRFKSGDRLEQTIRQSRKTEVVGAPLAIASESDQVNVVDWRVQTVAANGEANVQQQVRQLRLKGKAGGQVFAFDSAKTDQSLGSLSGRLGPMLKALAKAKLSCRMDRTGKVSGVSLPQDVSKALQASVGGPAALTKDALLQMMGNSVVLPDRELSAGDSWRASSRVKLPRVGFMVRSSTYTYRGEETVKGVVLDKITLKSTFEITTAAGKLSPIQIPKQKTDGTIYFDNARGYLTRSQIKVSYTLAGKIAGRPISQQVSETTEVTLRKVE